MFYYPSNLYKEYDIIQKEHTTTNIQLGNSADPSNNHIDVLSKLIKYKDENIKIFTPLSYGDQVYAQDVIKKGKELFGDKFVALTEFMPFEKYLEFLGQIDIAIFAHKRQQAMGNTITLLGLGKKVYMRSDITPWQLFDSLDVKVYDVANIEIDLMEEKIKKENQQKITEYFSKENYLKQLQELFSA
ncbi:MAG: TDP-N-acetylfucosamine:lipid II N-acetylfucosaminyltransferase [Aliarcobacter sp.]|uniref:TDP-N-acetylfucosamine:lipid II N-acetylfucosaminyltransferase n=1 Tax=Aliarcobacter skirrowii TaxID=28200 RepID=UPI0024311DB9|nr:TDP-N-acetylfucosamine:lipid II N-acetylfucosaminyltransferase [Aliarcobacter skirrowii]MDD2509394.1 TDP-N-acetylfucosamine:lipid II N-acetylfucosaminyltransferase [Aliarcobacter skirrowii]MDD3496972.1 TDP-N-acetylfucosamine:lipid II N-acetylfucosaminyltransferase [Aliarcobacter skirrowii]